MPAILSKEELQAAFIYRENYRSILEIISDKCRGSGFMWDKEGFVVTNLHVILNASNIKVKCFDGKIYDAIPAGIWPDVDVAVLLVKELKGIVKPLSIDADTELFIGQKVFAIGNPYQLSHSLSTGVISGLNREDISASNGQPMRDVIQSTAAISGGSSGGPLFDSAGCVIGITTSICSPSGEFGGVGFSISIRSVRSIINFLVYVAKCLQPDLGIKVRDIYLYLADVAKVKVGHNALQAPIIQESANGLCQDNLRTSLRKDILEFIGQPMPDLIRTETAKNFGNSGGPLFGRAGQGLQKTKLDDLGFIIRSVCGKTVTKGFGLHSYLHLCKAGDTVTVTMELLCGGNKKEISVTLDVSESNVICFIPEQRSQHMR